MWCKLKSIQAYNLLLCWGRGAVLQTPPFRYAGRSIQFHLIKINRNKGNAGNLWSHMTQRVCFPLMWGLVHGSKYYKSDMIRYVCSLYSIFCVKFISVKLEWWKHVVTKGCGWDNESHFHRLIAPHVWGVLTLNSIRGPFRPESNFAYTQHWYLADVTLKTLCILQPRLSGWRKPIKILKRKSRVTLYRS